MIPRGVETCDLKNDKNKSAKDYNINLSDFHQGIYEDLKLYFYLWKICIFKNTILRHYSQVPCGIRGKNVVLR